MAKTAKITLDETEYTVRVFNMGEWEEISDLLESKGGAKQAFKIVGLAMRRATPKVDKFEDVSASSADINKAVSVILELNGMAAGPLPPEADQPAAQ